MSLRKRKSSCITEELYQPSKAQTQLAVTECAIETVDDEWTTEELLALSQRTDEEEQRELAAEGLARGINEVADDDFTAEEWQKLSQKADDDEQREFAGAAARKKNKVVRVDEWTTAEYELISLRADVQEKRLIDAAKAALVFNRFFDEILLNIIGRLPLSPTSLGLAAVSKIFAKLILNRFRYAKILKLGNAELGLGTNDQLRFWRMYINMRAYEAKSRRNRMQATSSMEEDGMRTALTEAQASVKLPCWLVGLSLELFCFLWPKEEPVSEFVETGSCSASQPNPITKPSGANFERILDVLKQLTGDATHAYSATPLKVLVNRGSCRWEDTELALDASWNWCKGTLFTALHILKAHKVDPETHFWLVVATMLLISHTAEEMVPILNWADRNAGQFGQVWLGVRHELPCLLYLLLWQLEGNHEAVTNGIRTELVRTVDCLALYDTKPFCTRDPKEAASKYSSQILSHEAMETSEAVSDDPSQDLPHQATEILVAAPKDPPKFSPHEAMETPEAASDETLQSRLHKAPPTVEQQAIIDLNLTVRSIVNVKAYAGTGKTTAALKQQKEIYGNSLMVFYNKSAQEDAEKRLRADGQEHVQARTLDSLISSHTKCATGRCKNTKVCNVDSELVTKVIPDLLPKCTKEGFLPYGAIGVSQLVKKFLVSDKISLQDGSFKWKIDVLNKEWDAKRTSKKGKPTKYANVPTPEWAVLADTCLARFYSADFLRRNLCFEILTKIVQLISLIHGGKWNGRDPAKCMRPAMELATVELLEATRIMPLTFEALPHKPTQVIIDEAQDLSAAQYDLFVRRQSRSTSIILLGDPYQSINGFRGAGSSIFTSENNLSNLTLPLTISHRFGACIAENVTAFLRTTYRELGSIDSLIGANKHSGRVLSSRARDELIGDSYGGNTIIITCSNMGKIHEAINVCTQLQAEGVNKKIAIVKGQKLDKVFKRIKSLVRLRLKLGPSFKINDQAFNDFDEVVEWAEEHDNADLSSECQFAEDLEKRLSNEFQTTPLILGALDSRLQEVCTRCEVVESANGAVAKKCDLIISNTHQQKGHEFSVVIMSNDFASLQGESGFVAPRKLQDRFNLLYVAMTRARDVLVLNKDLDNLIYHHLRPPVAALRLPRTVGANCCVCGEILEGEFEDVADVGGEGGGVSQGSWAASTRRWGLQISVSKDRHARGHVSTHSDAAGSGTPSACCSVCLSETLKGPIRPTWAPPAISPVALTEFWGPEVLPPPPQNTME